MSIVRYDWKASKIRERLGREIGLEGAVGGRPKRMRRRTYDRLVAELWNVTDEAEDEFAANMAVHLLKWEAKLGR